MASKQRRPTSSSSVSGSRRGIMRPIISSDVMGNRNVEIVPVGAWVEHSHDYIQADAVLAAQIEEEKIRHMREEKENQLRSFQREVKKRVGRAREVKRQQQIQEAEKAFELERRVVLQSFQTGDNPRKDTCSLRQDFDHAIRMRLLEKYGEDVSNWGSEKIQNIDDRSEENHQVMDRARQQLSSKQISQQSSISSGNPKTHGTANREIENPYVTAHVDLDSLPASKQSHIENDDTINSEELQDELDEDKESQNDNTQEPEVLIGKSKSTVQFAETQQQIPSRKKKKRSAPVRLSTSAKLANLMSQFKEGEVLEQQKKQQAAISRRIFMDREREAVRENIRRQQHRLRITELKKEKEAYRQELEELAQRELDPVDSITGETKTDKDLREKMEAMHVQETMDRRKEELRRNREMERYLDALRHSLMEKASRQGINLPSLCACGDNLWDTHPETCANNCFFYKNHRAYARTLQSLLSSVEVM